MLRISRNISLLFLLGLSSCAALDTERNLAPLYSEHWKAGGGVETESLGGAILTHRPSVEAELDAWAIRPLFIHEWREDVSRTEFLSPFGTVTRTDGEFTWTFNPIARYSREKGKEGLEDRSADETLRRALWPKAAGTSYHYGDIHEHRNV